MSHLRDKLYVISPTTHISKWFCREILEIDPRKHSFSVYDWHKLQGIENPVIILYPWPDLPILWNSTATRELLQILNSMKCTVINMPEVKRISRGDT